MIVSPALAAVFAAVRVKKGLSRRPRVPEASLPLFITKTKFVWARAAAIELFIVVVDVPPVGDF